MPLGLKARTYERISYSPGCGDSGDLEAGTHTIVPTARPAITAAQYSKALTLPAPADARFVIKGLASRLNVNIPGLGTATTVNCAVRVDVDDAAHELFNVSWTSTGSKLAVTDLTSGTLFDLLKDGTSHTFYFLFWADVANQATIDVVQLWEAVGFTSPSTFGTILRVNTGSCLCQFLGVVSRVGTGEIEASFYSPTCTGWSAEAERLIQGQTGGGSWRLSADTKKSLALVLDSVELALGYSSVENDLGFLGDLTLFMEK